MGKYIPTMFVRDGKEIQLRVLKHRGDRDGDRRYRAASSVISRTGVGALPCLFAMKQGKSWSIFSVTPSLVPIRSGLSRDAAAVLLHHLEARK